MPNEDNIKIDENGYERKKPNHSDLIHRQIAYKEIYLSNRDKYPLPFSKYQIHHIDGNKRNNAISNLKLVTRSEHRQIHNLTEETNDKQESTFKVILRDRDEPIYTRKVKKYDWGGLLDIILLVLLTLAYFIPTFIVCLLIFYTAGAILIGLIPLVCLFFLAILSIFLDNIHPLDLTGKLFENLQSVGHFFITSLGAKISFTIVIIVSLFIAYIFAKEKLDF